MIDVDWYALTKAAVAELNNDNLDRAQATAQVGICAALSEIAYQLRDDNCDSSLISALKSIAAET
jgi:hypothetical protein